MRRLVEQLPRQSCIPQLPVECDVVGRVGPDRRLGGPCARLDVRGQKLVVDLDQPRRLVRLLHRFGDDESHAVAHVPHAVDREDWTIGMQRLGASVGRRRYDARKRLRDASDVLSRQDGEDARRGPRRRDIDGPDARVGMGRAHDNAGGFTVEANVVHIDRAPGQHLLDVAR